MPKTLISEMHFKGLNKTVSKHMKVEKNVYFSINIVPPETSKCHELNNLNIICRSATISSMDLAVCMFN